MNKAPIITVGFSTTHDPGAWYTLNHLLHQHQDVRDVVEWIVIDNSPRKSPVSKEFEQHVAVNHKDVRYIRDPGPPSSCAYKDRLFYEATSPIVVCMDSHVLLSAPTVPAVMRYFAEHSDSRDMLMGRIYNAAGHCHSTNQLLFEWEDYPVPENAEVHHGIVCRGNQFGVWVKDQRAFQPGGEPYEIQMNGTWFFAMRRDAWPRFHPHFMGFGGNEVYLMEQVRNGGGRVLNHPDCHGMHNFSKAHGSGYTPLAEDKLRNYLVSALELGRSDLYDATVDYFGRIYPQVIEIAKQRASEIADRKYDLLMHQWRMAGGDVGGSSPAPLIETLMRLSSETRTLEFGCGLSTLAFDRRRTFHTAIEHSQTWCDRVRRYAREETTQIINSNISDGWYDWQPCGQRYDVILVDGPPGSIGRHGCVEVIPEILAKDGTVIIDDTHREDEQKISDKLMAAIGARRERVQHGQRAFDVLRTTEQKSVPMSKYYKPGTMPLRVRLKGQSDKPKKTKQPLSQKPSQPESNRCGCGSSR